MTTSLGSSVTKPIKSINVENYGPFLNLEAEFLPGLNVIIGDNGTGKTQLQNTLSASAVPTGSSRVPGILSDKPVIFPVEVMASELSGDLILSSLHRVVARGKLANGGYLFWDCPENGLNPAKQKVIADVLLALAAQGTQVFIATHSMFILREIQMGQEPGAVAYFGLYRDEKEATMKLESALDLDDIEHFVALEAESEQSQRYLAW